MPLNVAFSGCVWAGLLLFMAIPTPHAVTWLTSGERPDTEGPAFRKSAGETPCLLFQGLLWSQFLAK